MNESKPTSGNKLFSIPLLDLSKEKETTKKTVKEGRNHYNTSKFGAGYKPRCSDLERWHLYLVNETQFAKSGLPNYTCSFNFIDSNLYSNNSGDFQNHEIRRSNSANSEEKNNEVKNEVEKEKIIINENNLENDEINFDKNINNECKIEEKNDKNNEKEEQEVRKKLFSFQFYFILFNC